MSDAGVKVGRRGALLGAIASVAATVATRGASARPQLEPEGTSPEPKKSTPEPAAISRGHDIREFPLGFLHGSIGPHSGTVSVVARPQIIFHAQRLVMPVATAMAFELVGIRVGQKMFRTPGPLGAAIDLHDPQHRYDGALFNARLEVDAAAVGQDIELFVENVTDENQRFIAALIGMGADVG